MTDTTAWSEWPDDYPPTMAWIGKLMPGQARPVTLPELHRETVRPFVDSRTRQGLFDGFALIRERIGVIRLDQWVGGPYATMTEHPEVLHCLTLFDSEAFRALPPEAQQQLTEAMEVWCAKEHTERLCGCHSAVSVLVPDDHVRRPLIETVMRAWLGRFGATQGYFVVPLIPDTDHAAQP